MKAAQYMTNQLAERLLSDFNDFMIKQKCEHQWDKYGHGYLCFKCKHYTGNSELTKLIEKELSK